MTINVLIVSDQIISHLLQPHQADQMLTPAKGNHLVETCIDDFSNANQSILAHARQHGLRRLK